MERVSMLWCHRAKTIILHMSDFNIFPRLRIYFYLKFKILYFFTQYNFQAILLNLKAAGLATSYYNLFNSTALTPLKTGCVYLSDGIQCSNGCHRYENKNMWSCGSTCQPVCRQKSMVNSISFWLNRFRGIIFIAVQNFHSPDPSVMR